MSDYSEYVPPKLENIDVLRALCKADLRSIDEYVKQRNDLIDDYCRYLRDKGVQI